MNLEKIHISDVKTGDIILICSKNKQGEIIQKFQIRHDAESGIYNHSGLAYVTKHGIYIIEASYIQQRKIKAAVVITKLSKYFDKEKYEIIILSHSKPELEKQLEEKMFEYVGTPYAYRQLTFTQGIYKLFNVYIGKTKKTDKAFICHELTQTVWYHCGGLFNEDYYMGNVKSIYHEPSFKKCILLTNNN
jgi:hypothetical protein